MAEVISYQTREEFIQDINKHKDEEVYIGNINDVKTPFEEEIVVVHGKNTVPFFIENKGSSDVTIFIRNISDDNELPKIEKADTVDGPWSVIDENGFKEGFTIKPNEKVYIIGSNIEGFSKSNYNFNYFSCEDSGASLNLGGNLETLFTKSVCASEVPDYCFYGLFMGLSGSTLTLDETFKLSSKKVGNYSYAKLFNGCKNLVSIPGDLLDNEKSDIKRYAYCEMFMGCSILTVDGVFKLPAESVPEGAYQSMFKGTAVTDIAEMGCQEVGPYSLSFMYAECTGITGVTQVLPATTLGKGCYDSFFYNCSNLTTVPEDFLPAETLAPYCYYSLFSDTSVANVKLKATTLEDYCYKNLFQRNMGNWTEKLVLPAAIMKKGCYEGILFGTKKTKDDTDIKMDVEIWATDKIDMNCAQYFSMFTNQGTLHLRSDYAYDIETIKDKYSLLGLENWKVEKDLKDDE